MKAADFAKARARETYAFGLVCFVPHPGLRGLYMKTHICVDLVACPTCKANVYEPCRSISLVRLPNGKRPTRMDWMPGDGWTSETHYTRRNLALRGSALDHFKYTDRRGRLRNRPTISKAKSKPARRR